MDVGDPSQLEFRGQDATECEDFIRAISKYAFTQGKQRDDEWIADLAATCMANDALRWWGALDEEVQGRWKLLRRAMLSNYRPMFHGGSGEEAEKFIRGVNDKAINEGKQRDNDWIVTYASSCLAGEALRWYTYLDSSIKYNWEKLQQALLTRYPRDGSDGPTPNLVPTPPAAASFAPTTTQVTRRGRIGISNSSWSIPHYFSKRLPPDNRIRSTPSLTDALEVEWSTRSDGLQALSIPGSQIPGHDLLGAKWGDESNDILCICAVDSRTNSTPILWCDGALLTSPWKLSKDEKAARGNVMLFAMADNGTLYPRWNVRDNLLWFSDEQRYPEHRAEMFIEPI